MAEAEAAAGEFDEEVLDPEQVEADPDQAGNEAGERRPWRGAESRFSRAAL